MFRADAGVVAGGQVRGRAGRRAAAGERVEHRPAGRDQTPDKTQRLPNHASWDELAAMSAVRRFAVAGMDDAARRNRRPGGMRAGVLEACSRTGKFLHYKWVF